MRILAVIILSFILFPSFSQDNPEGVRDTTIILISDMQIQIEATDGLNAMYNFKFGKARGQFLWLKEKYKWHPLPYFLLGLNEWWKIMPNVRNTQYDENFEAYMDTVINISEELFEKPEHKIEAAFFLSAAYGFKGRLYSDEYRKNWSKATYVGKQALNYLEVSKGKDDLSPELLFGDALYNYFSNWIPENYPILRPVMLMFPNGDKELGLKQLREVSFNAFYTRTEAMVWLMRILNNYENDQQGAMYLGEYLYNTYPDNAYFHRYYARLLYGSHRFQEAERVCLEIIERIEKGQTGYEATSGRYAAFFLGHINQVQGNYQEARRYYLMAMGFAQSIEATDTGYYLYSIINIGEIYERENDKKNAREYYKLARKEAPWGHPAHKSARKKLREL